MEKYQRNCWQLAGGLPYLVIAEAHLRRVLRESVASFNRARPHQGLQQRVPEPVAVCALPPEAGGRVRAVPVLGGLHHTYLRAA